ncbi:cobaltochelatase subunit CobN [Sneathiella aquimaris]|uniref:cobaltochelatase subunit CobN n=1 Tax=Sneathiella aquimaris TaxID=2599305 RepID=UPI00146C1DE7|nr:cobaltochelatase subunit CobN [Sneathiella aquimaris]
MHVVFRESHGLEENEVAQDLGQDPADLVVLSFSDSDLGAFAAGWEQAREDLPSVRLANLAALKHPLSVDVYIENTLQDAKAILIRLIGGEQYWQYGLSAVNELARREKIALAVLPADGRNDPRLDAMSTVSVPTLRRLKSLCDQGGAPAAETALKIMAGALPEDADFEESVQPLPLHGFYDPDHGYAETLEAFSAVPQSPIIISFYRSYLTSADLEPVDALIRAFRKKGFACFGVFAASLKANETVVWLEALLPGLQPEAIVNLTAFSAKGANGKSPLEVAGCPVFQTALSTAPSQKWAESERGLSPADLAMFVAMPEVDGRIFTAVTSFKEPSNRHEDLQFSRFYHRADLNRVAAIVQQVSRWITLARKTAAEKHLAFILSTYPGKDHQIAHAVGLDALASMDAILSFLNKEGYQTGPTEALANQLLQSTVTWPLELYLQALKALPGELRQDLSDAWGDPEDDPTCRNGFFEFRALRQGQVSIALQPERGHRAERDDDYHDLARIPCHGYVAFYLWLQHHGTISGNELDALVHIGAHGTLEWLPGKSVALSDECWPDVLTGSLPVIYPFIVNDPGEAVQAKRRIGAVTLGHMPPPMKESAVPSSMVRLERLLDEYSTADGLDPNRRDRLVTAIREEAQAAGVEEDIGIEPDHSAAEALVRIDRFVCDIKESQFGDGLHIYGEGVSGSTELEGLLKALSGQAVAPGPSGSPFKGRDDVLPTGRNLYSTDPRAVPTRAAYAQGVKLAEELVRRHLQDHGDYPRALIVDLWGSATMRTAGEEFAMALHLAGVEPKWGENSDRVTGFEILPLMMLDRPRIDVTLRVSGLFRDIFPNLSDLFNAATATLATRDEGTADNPYQDKNPRVFGPKPGLYGVQMDPGNTDYTADARMSAGESWLAGSEWVMAGSFGDQADHSDRETLEKRVLQADAFVHSQDLPETDLLLAMDYATHEAGFAAAHAGLTAARPGEVEKNPVLYHLDNTRSNDPKARTLSEEIARVVRARATNPDWLAGMLRHGFRGGAEIAATLEHMAAFAHMAHAVPAHLFDAYYEHTLGDDKIREFLEEHNPQALEAMEACFERLHEAGLWVTRRNWIAAQIGVSGDG